MWAVITVGIVALICWRIGMLGIGYTITGLVAFAAILLTAPADYRLRDRTYRAILAVAVVGLLLVPTFRSADWVVVLALLTATGTALFLFGEAYNLRSAWMSAVAPFWTSIVGALWLFRRDPDRTTTTADAAPADGSGRSRIQTAALIALVTGITLVLLLIFGALLAGADPNFGRLFRFDLDISMDIDPSEALFSAFLTVLAVTGCMYMVHTGSAYTDPKPPRPGPTWTWAIPIGAVLAMFALFLAIQAGTLFRGDDFIRDNDGPTYSEYARQGFWQLLTVTVLVIAVMCIAWRFVDRSTPTSRLVVRILLGGLGVATLGIAASAIHRMSLYIGAYGATPARIFPLFVEIYLIVVIVLMLAVGLRLDASWLLRRVVVATAFGMLIFAVINPDRLAAAINVDHFHDTGTLDEFQLAALSPDALGEIMTLPEPQRSCVVQQIAHEPARGWQGFSLPDHHIESDADVHRILHSPTPPECPVG